jgi:protein-tyrosine phosphatase
MVIDFHSHILPGIDDGSRSLEQSIAMLKMEAEQGISKVIATPHFYAQHDKPERFLQKRAEAEKLLREEMAKHSGLPELEIGAEVYFFSGISDSDITSELTIGQKRYILIEMPMPPWSDRIYRDLESIWIKQDLIPVIAHVDRYIAPFHTFRIPERLEQLPVKVQANASFFLEKHTRRMALRMLAKGRIHLLGSDCHDLNERKPNLGEAVKVIRRKFGPDIIPYINSHEEEILGME